MTALGLAGEALPAFDMISLGQVALQPSRLLESSDEDLLRRSLADDAAFTLLVERYRKTLLYYVCRILSRAADAEDIVQETFLRLISSRELILSKEKRVRGFLFLVARHLAIDSGRKLRRETLESELNSLGAGDDCPSIENRSAPDISADIQVLTAEHFRILTNCLSDLGKKSKEQHECVFLYFLVEMSWTEIAAHRGTASSTVLQNVKRGVADLRRCFEAALGLSLRKEASA
jgi:RNA polymerase sigma-70 factor (ECF subfamily)